MRTEALRNRGNPTPTTRCSSDWLYVDAVGVHGLVETIACDGSRFVA
jgi:hypothetical protein